MKKHLEKLNSNTLPNEVKIQLEETLFSQAAKQAWKTRQAERLNEKGITPQKDIVRMAPFPKNRDASTVSRPILPRWVMGIAASVALVATVWFVMPSKSDDIATVDTYLSAHFATPSTRKDATVQPQTWVDAYADNQFDKAAESLKQINPRDIEQEFYLGLSLLYAPKPNYTEAVAAFKRVSTDNNRYYQLQAQWYCALALLKVENKPEAKVFLSLVKEKNAWRAKEASALLRTME